MASGWAWLGWLVVVVFIAYGAWAGWHFYSAKRQGLPPPPLKSYIPFAKSGSSTSNYPTPRARNVIEWIKDQFAKMRNRRTHQGSYEESGAGAAEQGYGNAGPAQRGRNRGLEDDAWDTRVGHEDPYTGSGPGGHYEEQELGLTPTPGYQNEPYGAQTDYMSHNTAYGGGKGKEPERGRNLTVNDHANPFGDEHAAPSLRSVSPRPAETDTAAAASHKGQRGNNSLDSTRSSPTTSMRRSHFTEDMR